MNPVTIYTTAPEAYDYSYCTSSGTVYCRRWDQKRIVIRAVVIDSDNPEYHARYQTGRYLSGMHSVWTAEEFWAAVSDKSIVSKHACFHCCLPDCECAPVPTNVNDDISLGDGRKDRS